MNSVWGSYENGVDRYADDWRIDGVCCAESDLSRLQDASQGWWSEYAFRCVVISDLG